MGSEETVGREEDMHVVEDCLQRVHKVANVKVRGLTVDERNMQECSTLQHDHCTPLGHPCFFSSGCKVDSGGGGLRIQFTRYGLWGRRGVEDVGMRLKAKGVIVEDDGDNAQFVSPFRWGQGSKGLD